MAKSGSEQVTQAEAGRRLGITAQAIGMWATRPGAPVVSGGRTRKLLWPDFPRWREAEIERKLRDESRKQDRPVGLADAEARKAVADAVLAELKVAQAEGVLISADIHRAAVGEFCDRLRAALVNLPANHLVTLERAGVPPKAGQALLEQISQELTATLREAVDDGDD